MCVCVCRGTGGGGRVTLSSQHVYWTELVVLDADSVLVYLPQLLCTVSAQVSVFVFGWGGEAVGA